MRTQILNDRRRFFKMQGKGLLSNVWSDGLNIVTGGLKNIGSKVVPIATEYAKELGKQTLDKIAKEAPKYIENKTRDFITNFGSSSNKSDYIKNFGSDTIRDLSGSFQNELRDAVNSQGTQNVINQIRNESKKELSNSASNILNSLLSGKGIAQPKKTRRRVNNRMYGNGMLPVIY